MGKPKRANKMREVKEKKEFEEEVLQIDRVTRVVKGGRRLRFRATVVVGDRKGRVGMGLGKATEVAEAIKKAVTKAKKDVIKVPIVKDTIPFEIKDKYKAARLLMRPAKVGTGIIAGSAMRRILELAGIKNVVAKSLGSPNKVNLAKATVRALKQYDNKEIRFPKKKKKEETPAKGSSQPSSEPKEKIVKKEDTSPEAKAKGQAPVEKQEKSPDSSPEASAKGETKAQEENK
jgi:small subunit ribosomal protein S5